jgi:hypothetical protein
MDRLSKIMYLILVAIALDRVCTLLPGHIFINDPFPLYDLTYTIDGVEYHVISLQAYVKAVTVHLSWIILLIGFKLALHVKMEQLLIWMITIEIMSLADFLLIYEQGLFYVGNYHVEFTDFRILGHAICIILWKMGKL